MFQFHLHAHLVHFEKVHIAALDSTAPQPHPDPLLSPAPCPQSFAQQTCTMFPIPPTTQPGKDEWEAVEGGFVHGIDLVKHIRRDYGDYFDIAVAGFPQHMALAPGERDQEIQWLKEKVDAGVAFIFTQMFYGAQLFIDWVKAIRAAGITIPIVPGIAPIQTWNGFQRATSLAKIVVPQFFLGALEPIKNGDEKAREVGTRLVADMCRRILKEDIGIRGLHFCAMNLEPRVTRRKQSVRPLHHVSIINLGRATHDLHNSLSFLHSAMAIHGLWKVNSVLIL